jgi:hypothetical protein
VFCVAITLGVAKSCELKAAFGLRANGKFFLSLLEPRRFPFAATTRSLPVVVLPRLGEAAPLSTVVVIVLPGTYLACVVVVVVVVMVEMVVYCCSWW